MAEPLGRTAVKEFVVKLFFIYSTCAMNFLDIKGQRISWWFQPLAKRMERSGERVNSRDF